MQTLHHTRHPVITAIMGTLGCQLTLAGHLVCTVATRPRDRNERSRTLFFEKKSPKLKIGKVPPKNSDLHQKKYFGNMSKPSQLLRSRRYLFSSKRLGRGKHKSRQGSFVETGSTFDTCRDSTGLQHLDCTPRTLQDR